MTPADGRESISKVVETGFQDNNRMTTHTTQVIYGRKSGFLQRAPHEHLATALEHVVPESSLCMKKYRISKSTDTT